MHVLQKSIQSFLPAVVLALLSSVASAVAGAQALPTATGPGTSIQVGGGVSGYHLEYGQRWLGGVQGWVDYNPLLRFGIEGEARWLRYNQDLGTHAATYLVGPRFLLHRGHIEPYAKVLAGSGRFAFPYGYAHGDYFVVAGGGGVDLRLTPRLYIRVVDVEYQQWPKFTYGSMPSYGASAGISYVIHRGETWRSR